MFRKWIDYVGALNLLPSIVMLGYIIAMAISLHWYFDYEVKYVNKCDAGVMKIVLDSGVDMAVAKSIACTDIDVIGHPLGYTAMLSTMVGAGAAIFGFYVNGRGKVKLEPTK